MTAADKIAEAHRSDEEMLLKVGCPWCGQTENLRFRSVGSLTSDMPARPHKVLCMNGDCEDVSGPVAYGKLGAARAWNKRADLADAQAQENARQAQRIETLGNALAVLMIAGSDTALIGSGAAERKAALLTLDAALKSSLAVLKATS